MRYTVRAQFANNDKVLETILEGNVLAEFVMMFASGFAAEHEFVKAGNAPSEGRAVSLYIEELS